MIAGSLILAGILAFGAYSYQRFSTPGPLVMDTKVIIPAGSSVRGTARLLDEAGALSDDWLFVLAARLNDGGRGLKAGEYALPAEASIQELLDILRSGETVQRRVTVAEGLTSGQVVAILNAVDGLAGGIADIPAEGTLLPETYFFSYGDRAGDILRRMRADRDAVLEELWASRAPNLPLGSPEEAVILASIIEKETAIPEERGQVAAVFINRLDRGMRLQSDPTVIYGLTQGEPLGHPIRRSELEADHPYNTYKIHGLPPGPIANPGRQSLHAALNPDFSSALYFVADGTGGHVFANTLEEHNRNVAKWRKIEKQKANQLAIDLMSSLARRP